MTKKGLVQMFVLVWLSVMLCFPASLSAQSDCLKWSKTICGELGAVHLSCKYRGPAVVAEALVVNKVPLKKKGFRFDKGAYSLTVSRLGGGRW